MTVSDNADSVVATALKSDFTEQPGLRIGKSIAFLISLVYATVLASLPILSFQDRENYLKYAEYSQEIIERFSQIGPIALISNEPIWLLVNSILSSFLSPEDVLRFIIWVSSFAVSYIILRSDAKNWPWILIFLLMPQILKNHITHLRQGLAIAVFLLGWFSSGRWVRRILMVAAAFIHASFFFVLVIYGTTKILQGMRLAADIRGLVYLALGVGIGLTLGVIAVALGARQGEVYDFTAQGISGMGFLFWASILAIFILQGQSYLNRHAFVTGSIIFYLGTYFFIEVTARIFESTLPLVFLAGLELKGRKRMVFLGGVVVFSIFQWLVRLNRSGPAF